MTSTRRTGAVFGSSVRSSLDTSRSPNHGIKLAYDVQNLKMGPEQRLLMQRVGVRTDGKRYFPWPVMLLSSRNAARACGASGTRCRRFIFIFSAGIAQTAPSKSNSLHSAARNSPGRTKVKADSSIGRYWTEKWCRLQELNPRPTDYKSVALPTELNRRAQICYQPRVFARKGRPGVPCLNKTQSLAKILRSLVSGISSRPMTKVINATPTGYHRPK